MMETVGREAGFIAAFLLFLAFIYSIIGDKATYYLLWLILLGQLLFNYDNIFRKGK